MKKIILYTLLCLICKSNAASLIPPKPATVEFTVENEENRTVTLIYDAQSEERKQIGFTADPEKQNNHFTRVCSSVKGLSEPETGGVWSQQTMDQTAIEFILNDALPKDFILRLHHNAFGNNCGSSMNVWIADQCYEMPLCNGWSSIGISLPEGEHKRMVMVPPFPQKPGNGDPRMLAVWFIAIEIIAITDTKKIIEVQKKEEESGGRKPLPLNKGLEKQAQRLRDFIGRGFK